MWTKDERFNGKLHSFEAGENANYFTLLGCDLMHREFKAPNILPFERVLVSERESSQQKATSLPLQDAPKILLREFFFILSSLTLSEELRCACALN